MANKITDKAAAAAIPGGVGSETFFGAFTVKVDHTINQGKDPDSGSKLQVKKNELLIRMKATTAEFFGFASAKDAIINAAKAGNSIRPSSQGRSYTIVLTEKTNIGGSRGTKTLAMPVPGFVSVAEFFDLIDKLPKNKNKVAGFKTPAGQFYSV